jgi:hypothetical protein
VCGLELRLAHCSPTPVRCQCPKLAKADVAKVHEFPMAATYSYPGRWVDLPRERLVFKARRRNASFSYGSGASGGGISLVASVRKCWRPRPSCPPFSEDKLAGDLGNVIEATSNGVVGRIFLQQKD